MSDAESSGGLSDDGCSSGAGGPARDSAPKVRPGADWQDTLRGMCEGMRLSWPVRVILPCAGWDAPSQALQAMGVEHTVVGAWDTDANCVPVWREVHGVEAHKPLPSQFHAGRRGDVQKVKLRQLPDADLLVSGPACRPISSQGMGRTFADPRSATLLTVLRWIFHLAARCLRCFVLENVMGMRSRRAGGKAPADEVVAKLRRRLPGWHIEVAICDSQCSGQSRKRVYVVGYVKTRSAWRTPLQEAVPRLPARPLSAIIDRSVPNGSLRDARAGFRKNLQKYMQRLERELHDPRFRGQYAVIEISRNPDKRWGARARVDDRCPRLRARLADLFIISLGEGERPAVLRFLHEDEAAALQGMSAGIIPPGMSRGLVFRGLGNAMTVPVVGAVMLVALSRAMGMPDPPRPRRAESGDSDADCEDQLEVRPQPTDSIDDGCDSTGGGSASTSGDESSCSS